MTAKKKTATKVQSVNRLDVRAGKGEDRELLFARIALNPAVRHASTASTFAAPSFGSGHESSIEHDLKVIKEAMAQAEQGDKAFASGMLAAQAMSLDAIFTELARRSAINMGEYRDAAERYMKLALKAQANCRATLEALTKLHQPREQTVKHVHVNDGGQAVVTDQFHQHGGQNEKSDEQSHATGAACESTAMLGQDAQGNGVPISSREGEEKVSNARRSQSRRT